MIESQESKKKKPKKHTYKIDEVQRKTLIGKIYPILLLGSLVWLSGDLLFTYLFSDLDFTGINLGVYITVVIVEVNLFILFFLTCKYNKKLLGFLLFITISFLLGIISLPVALITDYIPQVGLHHVHMFVSLSVGANLIVNFMTLILRNKYFAKGYVWVHILLFLVGVAIVEIVFIIVFNIQNYLLTVPISLTYILIVSLILIFYAVQTVKTVEKENWIYAMFKVLFLILVCLGIAVIIAFIVLIVVASILGGEALDLSGLGGGGGGSSGRKKKKV